MEKFIFLLLLIFITFVHSDEINIENGETIFISDTTKVNYNFIVPESESYEEALILTQINYTDYYYTKITENESTTVNNVYGKHFNFYRLYSKRNETISFEFDRLSGNLFELTLIDITKEISLDFNKFLRIIPELYIICTDFNPIFNYRFDIKEIDSDRIYYFINSIETNFYDPSIYGNKVIEHCYEMYCLNNTYNATRIIFFQKGLHYKIRINYLSIGGGSIYYYPGLDGILYNRFTPLTPGFYQYDIDKINLGHLYIIDNNNNREKLKLYSKNHAYIQYSPIDKSFIDSFPNYLENLRYEFYNPFQFYDIPIESHIIIVIKDKEEYEKNNIYIYNDIQILTEGDKIFNLIKGNYGLIYSSTNYDKFFISVECNKPSLTIIDEENGYKIIENLTQVENEKFILVHNEQENIKIKMRYYIFDRYNTCNYIFLY